MNIKKHPIHPQILNILIQTTFSYNQSISNQHELEEIIMNTAKLSSDGTHQTVILPPDFQMTGTEVYI